MLKNINPRIQLCFSCFILLFCVSCQPVYVPNVVNIPLLEEKGDVQFSFHSSLGGIDFQSAAAISDKFALMANANFQNRKFIVDTDEGFRKQNFVEIAAGYRTKIGENGRFESFGGIGYGTINASYPNDFYWRPILDVKSSRAFLQPNIGFVSDIVDFGFAPRIAYVSIIDDNQFYDGLFIEPAFSLKLGYKYVKGIFQAGLSLPANRNQIIFDYNPFLLSIGLQISLNLKSQQM